jgi:hypothetical protein
MHLAVAPATLAYQDCVAVAEHRHCVTALRQAWPAHSGNRITYALMAGLIPVPIGWIIGWALFVRKDPLGGKRGKRAEATA